MEERRGLRKRFWLQIALLISILATMAWAAFADGDRVALIALVMSLVFCAYVFVRVIGFRSAKRLQSELSEDPRSDTEDPLS